MWVTLSVFPVVGDSDPIGGLRQDFDGVPMLADFVETSGTTSPIVVSGPDQNIWLESVNNALE